MNVRPKTIKLLEEKTGSTLFDTGLSNIFLDMSPQARETKAKKNKWDYIEVKPSVQHGKPATKQKDNLLNGRRYMQIIYPIRA